MYTQLKESHQFPWRLRSRFCICCCFNIKLLKDGHQNQL